MQIEEGLAFHLASLAHGTPLTSTQLTHIIQLYPESQSTPLAKAMLRLLHITEQTLALGGKGALEDTLGLILQGFVGKLKLEEPLRWLAACEFDQFREYCARMQDNQLRSALQWSFGLYPRASQQHPKPTSIFQQMNEGQVGNPHWLFSRKAMKDYYRIKCAKMTAPVKKLYMFLLADKELLEGWRNEPLKLLWVELYILYNGLLLEPHLKEARISAENDIITWLRPNITDTLNRIKQIEPSLRLEERMLLYLILAILSQSEQLKQQLEGNWLQDAFRAFLQGYNNLPQWQNLMAFLFFTNISKSMLKAHIQDECMRQFKILLSNPYHIGKLIPYLYFLLNEEEVLQIIHEKDLEYWRVPMPEGLKRVTANYLIERGVIHNKGLRYISQEDLLRYFFQSPKTLQQPSTGQNLLISLQAHQSDILQHLRYFGLGQNQAQQGYISFIQLWNGYYQLLQKSTGSIQQGESILISHAEFHPKLKSFHLPIDNPNVIRNVLQRIAKAYSAKLQNPAEAAPYLTRKLRHFRQNILPQLLQKLSAHQNGQCQQERAWFDSLEEQALLAE